MTHFWYNSLMKPSKKVIAVDIDEVLANFVDYFIEYHNLEYETTITKDKFITFELSEIFETTVEEMNLKFRKFKDQGHNLKLEPIKGSKRGIDKLIKRGYKLHIVTSRPETIKDDTSKWVEKFFPGKFVQVHHAFNKYYEPLLQNLTKAEICRKIGARVLIEDNLDLALDSSENGITVLMMDAPWNQTDSLPENVIRVKSWEEILGKIDKLWT